MVVRSRLVEVSAQPVVASIMWMVFTGFPEPAGVGLRGDPTEVRVVVGGGVGLDALPWPGRLQADTARRETVSRSVRMIA